MVPEINGIPGNGKISFYQTRKRRGLRERKRESLWLLPLVLLHGYWPTDVKGCFGGILFSCPSFCWRDPFPCKLWWLPRPPLFGLASNRGSPTLALHRLSWRVCNNACKPPPQNSRDGGIDRQDTSKPLPKITNKQGRATQVNWFFHLWWKRKTRGKLGCWLLTLSPVFSATWITNCTSSEGISSLNSTTNTDIKWRKKKDENTTLSVHPSVIQTEKS